MSRDAVKGSGANRRPSHSAGRSEKNAE